MEPLVSVVILTMDQPQRVMEDLKKQTYKNFEVIIASEKGIVNAMNKALNKAKGEIFVRIDDDVQLPERWLEELIKPLHYSNVAGATGPTFIPKERRNNRDSIRLFEKPNRFLKWLCDDYVFKPAKIYDCGGVSYDSNYEEKFKEFSYKGFKFCDHLEGTNWAMRTELIRNVGGFDPAFDGVAEWFDTDVEQKIIKQGYKIVYNCDAYLYHLVEKGSNFGERFEVFGRIDNWLKYHRRHSKFHYKKVIWLMILFFYALKNIGRR